MIVSHLEVLRSWGKGVLLQHVNAPLPRKQNFFSRKQDTLGFSIKLEERTRRERRRIEYRLVMSRFDGVIGHCDELFSFAICVIIQGTESESSRSKHPIACKLQWRSQSSSNVNNSPSRASHCLCNQLLSVPRGLIVLVLEHQCLLTLLL